MLGRSSFINAFLRESCNLVMLIGLLYNPQTRNSSTLNPTPSYNRSFVSAFLPQAFNSHQVFLMHKLKTLECHQFCTFGLLARKIHGGSVVYLLTPNLCDHILLLLSRRHIASQKQKKKYDLRCIPHSFLFSDPKGTLEAS